MSDKLKEALGIALGLITKYGLAVKLAELSDQTDYHRLQKARAINEQHVSKWSDHDRNVPLNEQQDERLPCPDGFEHWHTGGGCEAYVKVWKNRRHAVITTRDGASAPTADDWLMVYYPDHTWMRAYMRRESTGAEDQFETALSAFLAAAEMMGD